MGKIRQEHHTSTAEATPAPEIKGLRAAFGVIRRAREKLDGINGRIAGAEADKVAAEARRAELIARVSAGDSVTGKESREADEAIRDEESSAALYRSAVAAAATELAEAEEGATVIKYGAWVLRLGEHRKAVAEAEVRVTEAQVERERLAEHVAGLTAAGIVGDPVFSAFLASHEAEG